MTFLSAPEVAKILGVDQTTVRANAAKNRLGFRCVRVGKLWKFPAEEVYEYVYGKNWREVVECENEDTKSTDARAE